MRRLLIALALSAAVLAPLQASAGWLSKLGQLAAEGGEGAAALKGLKLGGGLHALEDAARFLGKLPEVPRDTAALAAHVSHEGHWTFATREGTTFTAATPAEMARLRQVLAPGLSSDGKLALYLSEDAAFANGDALKALPEGADLHLVVKDKSFKLDALATGSETPLSARIRDNLIVPLTNRDAFDEAIFLLQRPLNKSNVRMLAIEPGGPKRLSQVPLFDKTDKTTLIDRIDPAALEGSFQNVRGQTVLLTGRVEGDALQATSSGLVSDSLSIERLKAAAEAADVNLIILKSASTRQPGGRNWLWQKVEVAGLSDALARPTYADFFNELGRNRGALSVSAVPDSAGRTRLDVLTPRTDSGSIIGNYGPWAGDVADELAGRLVIEGATGYVRDKEREQELDNRFIPGIPAYIQGWAILNFIAGLIATRVSWLWWWRIWPSENREEYGTAAGYHAARFAHLLVYLLIFLPLVGSIALLWFFLENIYETIMAPIRWLKHRFGRTV